MLPQTPVIFMNAPPPPPPTPGTKQKQTKNMNKKKQNNYSSTQYIDIINIMLNSFQLKLVMFTKKKWTKQKLKTLCKHTPCHY